MVRLLSQGMTGEDVRNLQGLLNYHLNGDLPPLVQDGIFGPKTLAAVKAVQGLANIAVDGLVGPNTRKALVNLGMITSAANLSYEGEAVGTTANRLSLLGRPGYSRMPLAPILVGSPTPSQPSPAQPAPQPVDPNLKIKPDVRIQSVTVQVGNTFSWRPWAPSPFVVGLQSSFLFRLGVFPAFLLSPSVQFSKNGVRSPNGDWTGQGAIQISPPDPIQLGTFRLGKAGEIDLLSPFVQGFLQRNAGIPGGQAPQGGFAFGDQLLWQLFDGKLSLVVTGTLVFGWSLDDGKGQKVAPQVGSAIQADLLKILGLSK